MLALQILAGLGGVALLVLYFRSIVVVALLNSKADDFVERGARRAAIAIVHRFIPPEATHVEIQRRQAWVMPLFVLISVVIWFLMVQFAFTGILWSLRIEPEFWRALSSSGSALSTLGYLTPSNLIGEYLAVFQAAIGLAIVMLLFTFVPGYQASVQARESRVGWLYARTDDSPNAERYVTWLLAEQQGGAIHQRWEDWEDWFRALRETHTLAPILSYVPAIYRGKTWIVSSATVLDAATAAIACLASKTPSEVRLCQAEGITTMRVIAHALGASEKVSKPETLPGTADDFNGIYDAFVRAGLPVNPDRAACLQAYSTMRAEYMPHLHQIATATLTPVTLLSDTGRKI
ncbi:hypothetical protein K32_00920 [Kaistia sp. 32K]|uniref:hypothetical protein n=1 Tax=Kaistia sp. 32K TaxID=2795690 RepID=UPI0019153596|nr:hypothetical protein [Kaistia sp. 32K]BCP51475.1 hypothetical protein K32_00920 [Kaistia sp. 32K]